MSEQYPGEHVEQPVQPFPYSIENPPSAEVLEQNMYAVHATRVLPLDNILRAGGKARPDGTIHDEEPASFRPTLHFSLGGVVQSHSGGHGWDQMPYGVVAPLKTLSPHLVNIYPQDAFTLGNVPLDQEGVTLLVPEGTDTSHIPPEVHVKAYPPHQTLGEATDEHIKAQGGWLVDAAEGNADIGAPAQIEEIPINDLLFFEPYLAANPRISFGPHIRSIRGEAFRLGVVDQAVQTSIFSLEESSSYNPYNPLSARFQTALARHHLQELDAFLKHNSIPPDMAEIYETKKEQALEWLQITDCDARLRKEYGVTLDPASSNEALSEETKKILHEAERQRHDKDTLWEYVHSKVEHLPAAVETHITPRDYALFGELCSSMPRAELVEWRQSQPEVFEGVEAAPLDLFYGLVRSTVMGNQVYNEHLDSVITQAVEHIPDAERSQYKGLITDIIAPFLRKDSVQLPIALHVLDQQPLSDMLQLEPSNYSMQKLSDLIKRHPDTKVLVKTPDYTPHEQQIVDAILASGQVYVAPVDVSGVEDFRTAQGQARAKQMALSRLQTSIDAYTLRSEKE